MSNIDDEAGQPIPFKRSREETDEQNLRLVIAQAVLASPIVGILNTTDTLPLLLEEVHAFCTKRDAQTARENTPTFQATGAGEQA